MTKFLVVSAGRDASSARPVFATSDPDVIAAALDALLERVGVPADDPAREPERS